MSNHWSKFIFLVVAIAYSSVLFGQDPETNSPYSRLGLGDLTNQHFSTLNGMGDLAAGYHNSFDMNMYNPASLSYLRATAFEIGLHAKKANLSNNGQNAQVWSGNLSYIALGFPMRNPRNEVLDRVDTKVHWGMGFSLSPYSNVGYFVETEETRPSIDTILYSYVGDGGTYKFRWANSVRYKNFSAGLMMGYFFGSIDFQSDVDFQSLGSSYKNLFEDRIKMGGFIWNLGVQYDYYLPIRKGERSSQRRFTFGAYGNPASTFNTTSSQLRRRSNPDYSVGIGDSVDTLRNVTDLEGSGKLPAEIGIGFVYTEINKWRAGVNYDFVGWSGYENDAKPETLTDSWRLSIGGEYIPDNRSYNNFFKKMRYRAGAFYGKDPRSDGFNKQLTNYGITLGLGIPIILRQQNVSFVNFAFEMGQLGTENSLQENYYKLTVGFTLNDDFWFFKRKFN